MVSLSMLHLLPAVLFGWVVYASNTDLPSVLAAQPSLTKFTSLINGYPALLAAAQAGNMTIIAPNDQAFDTFFTTATSASNYSTTDELYALLQYHILKGAHTTFTITSTPSFIPSILTNSSYTNVTSGQVVKAVTNQTAITFHSAVHQVSNVVGSQHDIVFLGGLVHIVDAVMIPPLDALATVTQYPLTYFIESLSVVLTSDFLQILTNITILPNQTYFIVNSEEEASQVAGNASQVSSAELLRFIEYPIVPGRVVYSTDLSNGQKLATAADVDLTITKVGNDTYVNDAKLLGEDILIANGVIHLISNYLNASNPGARPQINGTTASSHGNGSNGAGSLSTGAKAGIAIGIVAAVLVVAGAVVLCLRKRRANNQVNEHHQSKHLMDVDNYRLVEIHDHPIHEKDSRHMAYEMSAKSNGPVELDAQNKTQELDSEINRYYVNSSTTEQSTR